MRTAFLACLDHVVSGTILSGLVQTRRGFGWTKELKGSVLVEFEFRAHVTKDAALAAGNVIATAAHARHLLSERIVVLGKTKQDKL